MNTPRVLVTGANGFIGSAVLRALDAHPALTVRGLVRRVQGDARRRPSGYVVGDLADSARLSDIFREVDIVVHAASYTGTDPQQCWAVNAAGTANLVNAARGSGLSRIIYVSTASVYGRGAHDGVAPAPSDYQPASETSRSRLVAEQVVQAGGGWIVRPHLVHGRGDRWFIPAVADLLTAAGGRIDCPALVSTIGVDDLARVLCALATLGDGRLPPGAAIDVNHPRPTSVSELVEATIRHLGLDIPNRSLPIAAVRQRLPEGRPQRDLAMFAHNRWYESAQVWDIIGQKPGEPFEAGLAHCADWYRRFMSGRHDRLASACSEGPVAASPTSLHGMASRQSS